MLGKGYFLARIYISNITTDIPHIDSSWGIPASITLSPIVYPGHLAVNLTQDWVALSYLSGSSQIRMNYWFSLLNTHSGEGITS